MNAKLSQQLALRIGVAARCLPGVELRPFMQALIRTLGLPITASKLENLRQRQFRRLGQGLLQGYSADQLALALAYLNGEESIEVLDPPTPIAKPYLEGEMPHSLRIAVASDTGETVGADFQAAKRFLIYQVSVDEIRLVAVRETPEIAGKAKKLAQLKQIADCSLVYAGLISNITRAVLAELGIFPVSLQQPAMALEIAAGLRHTLGQQPPPWLAKAAGLPSHPKFLANRWGVETRERRV